MHVDGLAGSVAAECFLMCFPGTFQVQHRKFVRNVNLHIIVHGGSWHISKGMLLSPGSPEGAEKEESIQPAKLTWLNNDAFATMQIYALL